MSKKRLYEIARELGKESKEVVTRAKELGIEVKSHSSSVHALPLVFLEIAERHPSQKVLSQRQLSRKKSLLQPQNLL